MMESVLSKQRFDVHRAVTDRIIEAIETGVDACVMPWHSIGGKSRPTNAATQMAYRGVNVIALWAEGLLRHYPSGVWASYKQWNAIGAQVRQGERGTTVVFYKEVEREDFGVPNGEIDTPRLIARASRVFNAAQVDGWNPEVPDIPSQVQIHECVETFIRRTQADVRYGAEIACYRAKGDYIEMPARERFFGTRTSTATESFYAVHLHELIHWTGAVGRLARELETRFGGAAYAMEELVAELGAAFLCSDLHVSHEPRPDHAAYIESWLQVLKEDPKAIFTAANRASAAVAYLEGLTGTVLG